MYLFVCEKSDEIGRDREHSERKKKLRIQGKKRKRKIAEQRIEKGKMNKKERRRRKPKMCCVVLCWSNKNESGRGITTQPLRHADVFYLSYIELDEEEEDGKERK